MFSEVTGVWAGTRGWVCSGDSPLSRKQVEGSVGRRFNREEAGWSSPGCWGPGWSSPGCWGQGGPLQDAGVRVVHSRMLGSGWSSPGCWGSGGCLSDQPEPHPPGCHLAFLLGGGAQTPVQDPKQSRGPWPALLCSGPHPDPGPPPHRRSEAWMTQAHCGMGWNTTPSLGPHVQTSRHRWSWERQGAGTLSEPGRLAVFVEWLLQ